MTSDNKPLNITEAAERIKQMKPIELVDVVIWESIMENTAHCGWTNHARDALVKNVQENVRWALAEKGLIDDQR